MSGHQVDNLLASHTQQDAVQQPAVSSSRVMHQMHSRALGRSYDHLAHTALPRRKHIVGVYISLVWLSTAALTTIELEQSRDCWC